MDVFLLDLYISYSVFSIICNISLRQNVVTKKEALYHHLYETPQELEEVLEEYIEFYNGYRPHRKLNMKTPIQYEAEFFSATEDK